MEPFICEYCAKVCKSISSKRQHEIRCKKNPNCIQPVKKTQAWYDAMEAKRGTTGRNQFSKARDEGRVVLMSDITKAKLSASATEQNKTRWTDDARAKHSTIMKQVVLDNPDSYSKNNVCGRVKIVEYNGRKLKGSWEVKTARWLDSNNIIWQCEVNPQPYFWDNGWHLYFPDFYLPALNVYIEVKGYHQDRDDAKWSQFKNKLIIIDRTVVNTLSSYTVDELIQLKRYGPVT